MRVLGIDTNVLLDYRLKRQPGFEQVYKYFKQCLEGKIQVYVPLPCILETEWVLRSFYKRPRDEIVQFFEELLLIDNLETDNKESVKFSINLYQKSEKVSFTDCVIAKHIHEKGATLITFDNNLEKLYKSLL